MATYTLKIIEIRQEAPDSITLCFKQPGLKKIRYKAGQYLTLLFRINGRRYIRPYSFSSCPDVDAHLEITIKRVQNGIVSNHIHDVVKVGDVIEVMEPMGDFVYESNSVITDIYLWGVGSGITPLMSIAKHILNTGSANVHLVYGNRNRETTIFHDQIMQMQSQFGRKFFVTHFYTQLFVDERNPDIVLGRIDYNRAIDILSKDQNISKSAHYICGPVGLKESVKKALTNYDIPDNMVFSEDFELVRNPDDFKDIETRVISLAFNNSIYNLEVVKGKSILETALDANIELPYSCQTGNCSTCKASIVKGEVKMIGLSHQRDDLKENEFLLCCTHPLTDNVHIEV